jgi:hypothetical protein
MKRDIRDGFKVFGAIPDDPDPTPFRQRLRRLAEVTAELPGPFFAGLAMLLESEADVADGFYATSWEDLADKREAWLNSMVDQAEEIVRKSHEYDRSQGIPPEAM